MPLMNFSQKFIVEEKHVKSYLEHLSSLETVKNIRQKQREGARQERHTRDVSDYKWEELVENCKLKSLTVAELDKYLDHHKLCKKGKKVAKIWRITAHYYVKCGEAIPKDYPVAGADEQVGSADSENETDSSGTDDQEYGNKLPIQQQTSRSGRKTGLWSARYADFVTY